MNPIPSAIALRAAQRLCTAAGVDLVLPGDLRREAVVLALGAEHALTRSGWDVAAASERVSVTLPALSPVVASALSSLPGAVGSIMSAVCKMLAHDSIFLAPAAMRDGATLLGVIAHELGHVGQIRRAQHVGDGIGVALWCLAYGVVPEVRAGAEAPCYGCDLAHEVVLGGAGIDAAAAERAESLKGYGLDADAMALARTMLRSVSLSLHADCDPTGTVAESLDALAAEGWTA